MRKFGMRYGKKTGGLSSVNSNKFKHGRAIQKVYQPHLTDEQAKDVIRRHLTGVPYRILADRTGFSEGNIRAICQGVNRSHLLREVEMEPKPMMGGK